MHGEVDGLKVSLAGARAKLAQIATRSPPDNTSGTSASPCNSAATAGRTPAWRRIAGDGSSIRPDPTMIGHQ